MTAVRNLLGQLEPQNMLPKNLVQGCKLLSLACSMAAHAESNSYPLNPVDRPLILAPHSAEIALGASWLDGNPRINQATFWNVRYGLSENLEWARLGLRYRFIHRPGSQWAISLQNYGLNPDGNHHTELSLEGKQWLLSDWAIHYHLGLYAADSHEQDGRSLERRLGMGIMRRLGARQAIQAEYSLRAFNYFGDATQPALEDSTAQVAKLAWSYTPWPHMDVVVGYRYSNFNRAVDSVLFNESYTRRWDTYINWRF